MGNFVISINGKTWSASTIVGVRHGLGSLRLYGDLASTCLREDTGANSMVLQDEISYVNSYTTIKCQVDDVETTFCSLAAFCTSRGLISISRKR